MNTLKELEQLVAYLKRQRKAIVAELRRMPDGKLMISSNGNRTSCFDIGEPFGYTHPKGIGRDTALVQKLAHKAYLEKMLARLNHDIRVLEKALRRTVSIDPAAVCKDLPKNFDMLQPQILVSPVDDPKGRGWPNPTYAADVWPQLAETELLECSAEEWAAMPYRQNSKFIESKVHCTANGIACRSKGEIGILGIYDELGIYYRYDEVLRIEGEYVSPDFRGVRNDGAFIIHEHFGLQDDEYIASNDHKLWLYKRAGFVLGKNLLITWDNEFGGTNLKHIRSLIRDIYHLDRDILF